MLRSSTPWFSGIFGHSDPLCPQRPCQAAGGRRMLPVTRRCGSAAADACPLVGRGHDQGLAWAGEESRRSGVGEGGGGHGATGGGEPLRAVIRELAAWPRNRGPPHGSSMRNRLRTRTSSAHATCACCVRRGVPAVLARCGNDSDHSSPALGKPGAVRRPPAGGGGSVLMGAATRSPARDISWCAVRQ
jgi:hypothetical protein